MCPSQRHEIPSFKPFSFCALCPAALWPLCVPCKVNKVSLWFHIVLNVESFQVQVDGSRGWKLLEDSWLDTRAEGRIGETEATMKQYSWERTWIWTRSSVDYHQVSSEVSWRTPVWKPRLERPQREAYNQKGYKSLWESGERSCLGISAWGVMNLLFKLADKTLYGKGEEVEMSNSFLKVEAEDWESLSWPLQRILNFLAGVSTFPNVYIVHIDSM